MGRYWFCLAGLQELPYTHAKLILRLIRPQTGAPAVLTLDQADALAGHDCPKCDLMCGTWQSVVPSSGRSSLKGTMNRRHWIVRQS